MLAAARRAVNREAAFRDFAWHTREFESFAAWATVNMNIKPFEAGGDDVELLEDLSDRQRQRTGLTLGTTCQ
jgi:hypothetical protein